MKTMLRPGLAVAFAISFCQVAVADEPVAGGPLKQYVAAPDESFHWTKRSEGELGGCAYAELTLTSQTWHDIVWKHQLYIIKPKEVNPATGAILLIDGGRWRDELEQPAAAGANLPGEALALAGLAVQLKSPVAILRQVPHQPILGGKVEDQIISFTFEQYLRTGDATWPLLLPMVKSAVRGMDTVQSFADSRWQLKIDHFTVTGASKRGWTTWLTAAIDPRVTALAPMVIDTLNMGPQMKHQLDTWGKFSEELDDYTNRGIQTQTATAAGEKLRAIVDPYSYRTLLKQPKLILLGTNDRYWPLDALNLYWSGLEGEKHILYCPNNGHGLKDFERVLGTLSALHRRAAGEIKLANLGWEHSDQPGKLRLAMKSDVKPTKVCGWVATSATKDFRDATWSTCEADEVDGNFRVEQACPPTGYLALFGEATYDAGRPYYFSTAVRIVGPSDAK